LLDILTLPFYKTWLLPEKIILKRTFELKLIARSFQFLAASIFLMIQWICQGGGKHAATYIGTKLPKSENLWAIFNNLFWLSLQGAAVDLKFSITGLNHREEFHHYHKIVYNIFSFLTDYVTFGWIGCFGWLTNSARKIDRGSFDRKSVDQNCVFSVDRNFHNQLTKILDAFQLIESFNNEFDQTPKI
jgi:hypothetical protein